MKSRIQNQQSEFMKIAIALAKRGVGKTSPNPAVGAVIVKHGKIIGKGYHKKTGLAHAEINALKYRGQGSGVRGQKEQKIKTLNANGADMYVTLEPCNHFGRTPPCTDAIIKAGIKKVYVGMKDPNPLVSGNGIRRLRNAGITVESGILENECKNINESYIKYITTKTPFVTLKLATTLDGKIATASGESKWITGKEARRFAHRMRAEADAVMVGIGTILKDNPELTTRLVKGKDPVRIIVDSRLRIPVNAKVVNTKRGGIIIIATKDRGQGSGVRGQKIKRLEAKGAEVWALPSKKGEVNLNTLMKELGKREITSLIIEGGSTLAASAIKQGVVDKFAIFVAPKIIGKEGLPMIGNLGIKRLKHTVCLNRLECKKIGADILLQGYVAQNSKSEAIGKRL